MTIKIHIIEAELRSFSLSLCLRQLFYKERKFLRPQVRLLPVLSENHIFLSNYAMLYNAHTMN